MTVFALIETIFRLVGLWDGLRDYVINQDREDMRRKLLDLSQKADEVKNANDKASIDSVQGTITNDTK